MVRVLQALAAVAALSIWVTPAAWAAGSTGSQGSYEPQGPDTGYDDMRADTAAQSAKDELVTGAALVKQGKFADAIPHLELAQTKRPHDVNVLIYLGFSHRMLGASAVGDAQAAEYDKALGSYQQALVIDPDNKLVHEYLGKLYLLTRKYALASNELKTLEGLCDADCAERTALAQAIAANPPPATADATGQTTTHGP